MLHDLDMITHSYPSTIDVYPVADVHLGAVEHAETEWQRFLQKVEQDNAYLILAGDLINNATRGTKFSNPFEETIRPREAKDRMTEYLKPIADSGRLLCIVSGNHEQRTARESDQDITYDICARLRVEHLYRENVAHMCVSVGTRNCENKAQATYNFVVEHGSGGGLQTGSAVNRAEAAAARYSNLDCYVSGHVHKGFVTKPANIVIDSRNKKVWNKVCVVVSCVPWMYYGGYAARARLKPAAVCDPQRLRLLADKNHKQIITEW